LLFWRVGRQNSEISQNQELLEKSDFKIAQALFLVSKYGHLASQLRHLLA
jgi:hypothetical protein